MRHGIQPPTPTPTPTLTPTLTPIEPAGPIAQRIGAGACVREMMRRGEIGGQALGLLQLVAAQRDPRLAEGLDRAPGGARLWETN